MRSILDCNDSGRFKGSDPDTPTLGGNLRDAQLPGLGPKPGNGEEGVELGGRLTVSVGQFLMKILEVLVVTGRANFL